MKLCGFLDSSLIHWKEVGFFASSQLSWKCSSFCSSLFRLCNFIHSYAIDCIKDRLFCLGSGGKVKSHSWQRVESVGGGNIVPGNDCLLLRACLSSNWSSVVLQSAKVKLESSWCLHVFGLHDLDFLFSFFSITFVYSNTLIAYLYCSTINDYFLD